MKKLVGTYRMKNVRMLAVTGRNWPFVIIKEVTDSDIVLIYLNILLYNELVHVV